MKLRIGLLLVLRKRHFARNQTKIDHGEVAFSVDLARRRRSAWNLVGIGRQLPPLGYSESNVLALIEFEHAVAKNNSTRAISDLLQTVNLLIASTKRDRSGFVANFNFGQTHTRTIDSILIDYDANFPNQPESRTTIGERRG